MTCPTENYLADGSTGWAGISTVTCEATPVPVSEWWQQLEGVLQGYRRAVHAILVSGSSINSPSHLLKYFLLMCWNTLLDQSTKEVRLHRALSIDVTTQSQLSWRQQRLCAAQLVESNIKSTVFRGYGVHRKANKCTIINITQTLWT